MVENKRTYTNKIFVAETTGFVIFSVIELIFLVVNANFNIGYFLACIILVINFLIYITSVTGTNKNVSAHNDFEKGKSAKIPISYKLNGKLTTISYSPISKEYSNESNSSNMWEGTVRGVLIVYTIIVAGFFAWRDFSNPENIPGHLIIVLGLILAYYKIEPNEVLPPPLVSTTSGSSPTPKTNLDLINSFPKLKKAIKLVEEKKEAIFEKIEEELTNKGLKVSDTISKLSAIEGTITNNIKDIENLTEKLTIEVKSRVESIGLICLMLFIAFVNALYLGSGTTDGSFEPVKIIASSIFAGVGIATGKAIDDLLYRNVRKPISNAFQKLNSGLKEVENFFKDTTKKIEDFENILKDRINRFKNQNFLNYFSPHISAIISINVMACLGIILLLNPLLSINNPLFVGMEFIISYYFVSKK
jgi:hypothetical protein